VHKEEHQNERRDVPDGKHAVEQDTCLSTAAANKTMCEALSSNCTWSLKKKACLSLHYLDEKELKKDRNDGRGGKHSGEQDTCLSTAGANKTMCEALFANCTWSEEKTVCLSLHYFNVDGGERKKGRNDGHGGKRSDEQDPCLSTGGNKTTCEVLGANCTWSEEKNICFYNQYATGVHGKPDRKPEELDGCFEHAGQDAAKCKSMIAKGGCAWSAENNTCYSVANHAQEGYSQGGKNFDEQNPCISAAAQFEAMCKASSPNCIWSAQRKVCYLARHATWDHNDEDQKPEQLDLCFESAGYDAEKCKTLVVTGRCLWSVKKKACYSVGADVGDGQGEQHFDNADAAVPSAVAFTVRLNNIQFSLLVASPSLFSEFELKVKQSLAKTAGHGVSPHDVSVKLKPGSVIVVASIHASNKASASTLQSNLFENPAMLDELIAEVKEVPGIQTATTGAITATLVSTPVVQITTQALGSTTQPPSPQSSSKLPFIIGSVCGGAAIVSVLAAGCCLWRKCCGTHTKGRGSESGVNNAIV